MFGKKASLLLLLLLQLFYSKADHIVGGELVLIHTSGEHYTLRMNFYFNDITGDPAAKDDAEYVSVFRKKDNTRISTYYLPIKSDNYIPNLGGNCSNGSIRTRLIRYEAGITLPAKDFSDSEGYYMTWERCCRNHTINNLQQPDSTGITIYLEFPAVSKNGTSFINSSPVFNDLANIYGCKGHPFYFDFGATDADKDSLVYSLVTPLKGHSTIDPSNTAPVGKPAPYDSVVWGATYDLSNVIHGKPSLSIDAKSGRLLVNPTEKGLFAFSVNCREYRDGQKTGEVRRDFQFFIDSCPPLFPPVMALQDTDSTFYKEGETINLSMKKKYCFSFSVADSTYDSLHVAENISYTVTGDAQPNVTFTIDSLAQRIDAQHPRGTNRLCVTAACVNGTYNYYGVYNLRIVARDRSCPVPLTDTLDITFSIMPEPNGPLGLFVKAGVPALAPGQSEQHLVYATNANHESQITLRAEGLGPGMSFAAVTGTDSISSVFSWQASCENIKTGASTVHFIASDNHCIHPLYDTITITYRAEEKTYPFEIHAPNLVTPNGDGYNEYFEIPDLPPDYCENYFEKAEIFNSWGAKVYEASRRDFRWNPAKQSEGIYYFVIRYSSKEYKGWVEVLK